MPEGERGYLKSSGISYLIDMADLNLDILVIETYNSQTMGVADASTYPTSPAVSSPTLTVTMPGYDPLAIPFIQNDFNILNSAILQLTNVGDPLQPLPDGVWYLTYSVAPATTNYVNKSIIRVNQLQEKFDKAFMKMDMMQCDLSIRKQQKITLDSIYYFIQGAVAAANNCAVDTATKLYVKADKMLDNFVKNNCNCSGNNY